MYARTKDGGILRNDGSVIPLDPENMDYAAFLAWEGAGNTPAAYQAPMPTVSDVRVEAQRRIFALVGAPDFNGCIVKQLNANMRATELTNKVAMNGELTAAEQKEAAALHAMAEGIKAIRTFSNAMEKTPPADYASDSHWT